MMKVCGGRVGGDLVGASSAKGLKRNIRRHGRSNWQGKGLFISSLFL